MTLIACSWPHSQVPNPLAFPGPPSDPDSLEGARSLAQHGQHFEQCEPGNRIGVCLIVTTAVPQVWQSAGAWRVLKQSAGPGERASKCGRESRAFVIYDALRGNVSAVHGAGLRHFPPYKGGKSGTPTACRLRQSAPANRHTQQNEAFAVHRKNQPAGRATVGFSGLYFGKPARPIESATYWVLRA
jgi:hypothetical protein